MQNNFTFLQAKRGLLPWLFSLLCVTSVWGQTCPTPSTGYGAPGADQVGSTSARLIIYGGENGANYEFQYKPLSSTAPYASYTLVTALGANEFKSVTITGLLTNTIYTWRVRTLCTSGQASAFITPANNFQTNCPTVSTGYGAPWADNVGAYSARLNFYGGESGSSFEVQYKPVSSTAPYTSYANQGLEIHP